jgi:hypothetical protein
MYNDSFSPEKMPGSGESEQGNETSQEVLLAVRDTHPATGETFWYIRDANGDKVPLNTKQDEGGKTRELLSDGTLGREIAQDPLDDPERVRSLYGQIELDNAPNKSVAEQTLPTHQKIPVQPISLTTESLPDSHDPISGTQGRANALASQSKEINTELAMAAPENDNTSENPAEFSENVEEYRDQIQSSLDSITSTLMQKADTLNGLGMPDAARIFATRTEFVHSTIQSEINNAGTDYPVLVEIYSQYFEGQPSIIAQIDPVLSDNSSTIKFEQLLSRITTIPELTYVADKLVESRHNLKEQKLEELKNATTPEEEQRIEQELAETETEVTDDPVI